MIQPQTYLNVADNSGARELILMCIRIIGASNRRYAHIGDVIVAVIKEAVPNMPLKRSEVVRAVIVRTCKELKRDNGMIIRYDMMTTLRLLLIKKEIQKERELRDGDCNYFYFSRYNIMTDREARLEGIGGEIFHGCRISDLDFLMESGGSSFPSSSHFYYDSEIQSDAESAPIDIEHLLNQVSAECTRCVLQAGKHIPPQWDMHDIVRTVVGDEDLPGFLTDAYYDIMICGSRAWLCEDICNFLDLINYVF